MKLWRIVLDNQSHYLHPDFWYIGLRWLEMYDRYSGLTEITLLDIIFQSVKT